VWVETEFVGDSIGVHQDKVTIIESQTLDSRSSHIYPDNAVARHKPDVLVTKSPENRVTRTCVFQRSLLRIDQTQTDGCAQGTFYSAMQSMHDSAGVAGSAFFKKCLNLCGSLAGFIAVTGYIDYCRK
jgi:hypothetical protein